MVSGLVTVKWSRLTSHKWRRDQLKTLALVLVLTGAAVLINPNTTKMFYYPFFTMNSKAIIDNIAEWSSPNFHHPVFKAFLAYLFLVYATLIISKKPVLLSDLFMLGLFTYLAMFGARNIALFMFVTGPMLAAHLRGLFGRERPAKQILPLNWSILVLVVVLVIYKFPAQMTIDEHVNKERFPALAVEYMKEHNLQGSLFNEYSWGGYLLWTRYPDNLIFIDGRADIYEDKVLPEYMRIMKLRPDAYALLLKYNPKYVLLPPGAPINLLLEAKGDWKIRYRDNVALLYEKVQF